MKNKLIKLAMLSICFLGIGNLTTLPVAAATKPCDSDLPPLVLEANGCNTKENKNSLSNTISNILYAIIGISGLVAVIFIIIGGVTYMTSTGDAGKVKKAKDTILYAVIGLIVCALSFAIVNWTIGILNNNTTNETETEETVTEPGN